MLPLLKFASDEKIHTLPEAVTHIANLFHLTEEEKQQMLPSGLQAVIFNRVGWARTYLKKAGLLEDPKRATFKITNRGLDLLKENLPEISTKYLNRYEEFVAFKVFTDDTGKKHRSEYGKALQEMSDRILAKSQKRGRLWALYRKFLKQDPNKARRILRHNLGLVKQTKRNKKYRTRCENEINRAFNEFYRERRPQTIAYEDLTHLRGKAQSKGLSRKVANWQRNIIKKRLEYKNYIYSVTDPGPVNAAYTSQQCPQCGWVDARNRSGDTFQCRKCGFSADADLVGAVNLKTRLRDTAITRYILYRKVKEILLQRYQQRQAR